MLKGIHWNSSIWYQIILIDFYFIGKRSQIWLRSCFICTYWYIKSYTHFRFTWLPETTYHFFLMYNFWMTRGFLLWKWELKMKTVLEILFHSAYTSHPIWPQGNIDILYLETFLPENVINILGFLFAVTPTSLAPEHTSESKGGKPEVEPLGRRA